MPALYEYIWNLGSYEMAGVAGFCCYILAFGSVQFGALDGNSCAYSCINIVAASLVAVSLLVEFNLASALIQGSWIAIGIAGLALRFHKFWLRKRRRTGLVSLNTGALQ